MLLLHNIGMPSLWVCGVFLVIVLYLLSVVVRLMFRYGTADSVRCSVIYLLLCAATFAFLCFDDGMTAQAFAFTLTLPLSLIFAKRGDALDIASSLIFCSLVNASAFLILFGLYQRARRAKAVAAAEGA